MARYLIDPFVFVDAAGNTILADTVRLYLDAVLEGTGGDGIIFKPRGTLDEIIDAPTLAFEAVMDFFLTPSESITHPGAGFTSLTDDLTLTDFLTTPEDLSPSESIAAPGSGFTSLSDGVTLTLV